MEPLILYFVLFFPGIYALGNFDGISRGVELSQIIPFSIVRELGRTLTYTLPSLALLWYIMSDKKGFSALKNTKPGKQDFLSFAIGLPGLILTGIGISLIISFLSRYQNFPLPPIIEAPANALGWIMLVFSCLGTGYLEESYFRYYLITKLEGQLPLVAMRIAFSTVLFSLCHIYEGPWGIVNAVLAGILLSTVFTRYKSLHGIAWAHGVYNIFVYIMGHYGS